MLGVPMLNGGESFIGFGGASLALLFGGGIALALWFVVFALRWFASMPKLPSAGPRTSDLGPEAPAVVNLLVNRWRLSHLAVQATLVDLAARGLLEIEMYVGQRFVVRLQDDRPGVDQPTGSFELQVLDLVKRRATGGSAPVEALDLGDAGEAESWLKRFNKSVASDAKKAGLARNRWARADWVVLGGGLFAVLQVFAFAFSLAHLGEGAGSGGDEFGRWDWLIVAAFAWLLSMVAFASLRDLRDTAAGRAACARWMGVREYLQESHAFDEAPLASVTVWERYLAYGMAMGAAHDAAESLPLAADDPNAAWTRFGGNWREIRINYPTRFGFGQKPISVFLGGLLRTAWWGGLAFVVLPIGIPITFDLLDALTTDYSETFQYQAWIALAVGALIVGWGLYLAIRLFDGVVRLWRGAADLNKIVVVEGEVVRVAEGRVAVADRESLEVNAWLAPVSIPGLSRGMTVRYTRTPSLWHVTKVEVISRPEQPTSEGVAEATTGDSAGKLIALEKVNSIMGRTMRATGTPEGGLDFAMGAGAVQAFGDDDGNRVIVFEIDLPPFLAGKMETFLSRISLPAIPGAGDPAGGDRKGGNTVVVRRGSSVTAIQVTLPGQSEAVARDRAEAIAAAFASRDEQRRQA
jgi:hypothetical protein